MDRRNFIKLGGLATLPLLAPRLVFAADGSAGSTRDVLVCIFLRGGADGLNLVVPYGEAAYYDLRPRIALPAPGAQGGVIDVDGFFGFHPSLAPLLPAWDAGELAVVHAVGSPDDTRSHFEAQDYMEIGLPGGGAYDGWLSRHLTQLAGESAFRAVGIGDALPLSLRGAAPAMGLSSIAGFSLQAPAAVVPALRSTLIALHQGDAAIDAEAARVFEAVDTLAGVDPAALATPGVEYPASPLGQQLADVAALIRAGLGLEVATLDSGNWDHHDRENEVLPGRVEELALALAAFREDLGPELQRVTVVTMTEFGRRAEENGSLGTDHGRASVMFALGGGVEGGRIHGQWPGLADGALYRGDLDVSTDFRSVLGEALVARRGVEELEAVFPGFSGPTGIGVFRRR